MACAATNHRSAPGLQAVIEKFRLIRGRMPDRPVETSKKKPEEESPASLSVCCIGKLQ
jgi:hypothetical protein